MMKKTVALLTALLLCTGLALSGCGKGGETDSAASSGSPSQSSSAADSGGDTLDSASAPDSNDDTGDGENATDVTSQLSLPSSFLKEIQSQAFYMVNMDTGTRVWERESQKRIPPASLTKIMTCILALENVPNIDREKTSLTPEIQNYLYTNRVDTLGGLYLNEELTIRDLLYAMMVQSANEAAMMVGNYVGGGDLEKFVEMMNDRAVELGAMNTHFADATGLNGDDSYTTAYDMSLIAQHAMKNETFQEIVASTTYTSKPTDRHPEGITWFTTNSMQLVSNPTYYYEGLHGIKTGTLGDPYSMHNFASQATRDGYTYLLVVLGAPTRDPASDQMYKLNLAFMDTQKLYDRAFSTFKVKTLMNIGKEIDEIGVRLSWDEDHVKLLAADKFATLVPVEVTEDNLQTIPVIYDYVERPKQGSKTGEMEKCINAPVKRNQEVGYVRLMLSGEEVGRVRLVAAKDVERSDFLYYYDAVQSFFNTVWFKIIVTLIIVIVVGYVLMVIFRNRYRRRYRARRKPRSSGTKPRPPR